MQSGEVGVRILAVDLQVKGSPPSSATPQKYKLEYAYLALGTRAKFCSELHLWLDCCTFGGTPQMLCNLVNNGFTEWDDGTF